MRLVETRKEALRWVAAGVNDCEIARRLDGPRTTVRDWRRPRYVPEARRIAPLSALRGTVSAVVLQPHDYAELLALYLGDGHIVRIARTERLRIFLDAKYTMIVDETEALLGRCFPDNPVRRVRLHEGAEVVLDVYSSHLVCLFPQHGLGRKHLRPIALEPWQKGILEVAPWAFLRGFIRSDGCCFVNRTGHYEYVSYQFSNHSSDVLDVFEATCRSLDCDRAATRAPFASTAARTWRCAWSMSGSRRDKDSLPL